MLSTLYFEWSGALYEPSSFHLKISRSIYNNLKIKNSSPSSPNNTNSSFIKKTVVEPHYSN